MCIQYNNYYKLTIISQLFSKLTLNAKLLMLFHFNYDIIQCVTGVLYLQSVRALSDNNIKIKV